MRVLHVATVVTPDGAYGGPVRVAVNLCHGLAQRGWDARVAAGTWGFSEPPITQDGVPLLLYPARRVLPGPGFAASFSPFLLTEFRQLAGGADLVHVHLGRDLVTLPFAMLCWATSVPYVVQTHGMVVANDHPLTGILDRLATGHVLRSARRVLWLTGRERDAMTELFGADLQLRAVRNGVRLPDVQADPRHSDEVLYMARLHPRKRPEMLVNVALAVGRRRGGLRLCLVGPDEGSERAVRDAAALASPGTQISIEGPLEPGRTLERMRLAGLYVLPSVDEPFPMSVLVAMSIGLPVVITDSCGLAPFVREAEAGIVVSSSRHELEWAVEELLSNPELRAKAGANARKLVEREFSLSAVAEDLDEVYRRVLSGQDRPIPREAFDSARA